MNSNTRKVTKNNAPILLSLCDMWEQYCPPPIGHAFMGAGEGAEEVLEDYGLMGKDGHIVSKKYQELEKIIYD